MSKLQTYNLFLQYYQNDIFIEEDWVSIGEHLMETLIDEPNEFITEGISLLTSVSKGDTEAAKYDFNRLFVGPNHLLVSPYASTYLNRDRVVMQNETMIVRDFYYKAGLEVENFGKEPDDHIRLELEFICYLLNNIINEIQKNGVNEDLNGSEQLLMNFQKLHFFRWVPDHCTDVIKFSQSKVCKGMAYILKGLITKDQLFFDNKGGTFNE